MQGSIFDESIRDVYRCLALSSQLLNFLFNLFSSFLFFIFVYWGSLGLDFLCLTKNIFLLIISPLCSSKSKLWSLETVNLRFFLSKSHASLNDWDVFKMNYLWSYLRMSAIFFFLFIKLLFNYCFGIIIYCAIINKILKLSLICFYYCSITTFSIINSWLLLLCVLMS